MYAISGKLRVVVIRQLKEVRAYHLEGYMNDNYDELDGTEVRLDSVKSQRAEVSKTVKWTGYESIRNEHATNLVVQSHGSEFTFLFFEVQPPFTTGTPEEQAAQLQELPYIEAKCVAKIVMSIPNALEAGNVLRGQVDNVQKAIQEAMKGAKNARTE